MSPDMLGSLTYGQFLDMYDGWKYARKLRMQESAQHAAWVMSPHTKRPVDPKKLLQEEKPKVKTTPEKTKSVLAGLMAEFGGGLTLWQQ